MRRAFAQHGFVSRAAKPEEPEAALAADEAAVLPDEDGGDPSEAGAGMEADSGEHYAMRRAVVAEVLQEVLHLQIEEEGVRVVQSVLQQVCRGAWTRGTLGRV